MTNEEAIKMLKQWNEDLLPYEDEKEGIECHNIAISALEKQIPKKPTPHIVQPIEEPIKIGCGRWGKGTTVYECPNCKEWVSKSYKYCHNCGQALDFNSNGSDTE
jgi:hypothetical protein|nr:MAG TPA: 50S ribosomal subunit [Caudoviricetes sp.]